MRLILASTSQRRKKILSLLGIPFEVAFPNFDEQTQPSQALEEEVQAFALGKAKSVTHFFPESLIIGSDTMILLEGIKIGKPVDLSHAQQILQSLSGKTHQILTGLAIVNTKTNKEYQHLERVDVRMKPYSEQEILRYLSFGEFLDKAGAYSLQGEGRSLIGTLSGDYLSAVGLPLKPIAQRLLKAGVSFPLNVDRLYAEKVFMNWSSF